MESICLQLVCVNCGFAAANGHLAAPNFAHAAHTDFLAFAIIVL
jgi:hypothetical protein